MMFPDRVETAFARLSAIVPRQWILVLVFAWAFLALPIQFAMNTGRVTVGEAVFLIGTLNLIVGTILVYAIRVDRKQRGQNGLSLKLVLSTYLVPPAVGLYYLTPIANDG